MRHRTTGAGLALLLLAGCGSRAGGLMQDGAGSGDSLPLGFDGPSPADSAVGLEAVSRPDGSRVDGAPIHYSDGGTPDPGAIHVMLPASTTLCRTQFGSQDIWPDTTTSLSPPGGGYPNVWQRIDTSNLDVWRIQAVDGYNDASTSLVSPAAYTSSDGKTLTAWNFAVLDKVIADGPSGAPRELDMVKPPDALWTGAGPLGGCSTPGTLEDQTYGQLAAYMANVVKYFRTGVLVTDAGSSVTYTASTLTDSAKDFTAYGGGGYAVTATVLDANGFPDWETATITSVTGAGHTLNLSWPSGAPAAGAAYNLAATTPPITSPAAARPWPRPPSANQVTTFELFNEPDLSNYTYPRTSPPLLPATPMLSGVAVSGGKLTPGTTYAYRITAVNIGQRESLPGTQASLTLPAGMNAVKITWSATSNLGLSPFAYRIYGRTPASNQAMVVVGRDAATGFTFIDGGSVAPSGALPTSDRTPGFQLWRGHEYARMWNVVAPAMKAVDPTIKLVGPTVSNPISLATDDVITTVATTGPGDTSWQSSADFVPALMATASPRPDAVTVHNYGWWQGSCSTDTQIWNGYRQGLKDLLSQDVPALGSTPVWIDETNLDAGFFNNTDLRAETEMSSAWLADAFVQACKTTPQVQQLVQLEVFNGNVSWGFISGSNAPSGCTPQPSCKNILKSQPNLEYWAMKWMNAWFPPGGAVVPVANVPAGLDAFAVQSGSTVTVVVVNTRIGPSPGVGVAVPGVAVQLLGATSSATQELVIDGTTSIPNGPSVQSLGALDEVSGLTFNPYGLAMFRFSI